MASLFFKLFNSPKGQAGEERPDSAMMVRIATSAILLEIASSDNEFTDEERLHIVETLKREFALSEEEAGELMSLARKRIESSIDFWGIASVANHGLSEEEKLRIMEAAWNIIYTDGKLSGHEDAFMHKLYYLLGLTHDQMIDIKMKVLNRIRGDAG